MLSQNAPIWFVGDQGDSHPLETTLKDEIRLSFEKLRLKNCESACVAALGLGLFFRVWFNGEKF